ncbi:cytochrome P450 [Amylocystis lapponica]|nr:cytochrome P450 [Amylocystis lapponica]
MSALLTVLDIAAAFLTIVLVERLFSRRPTYSLPPGPAGWPLIGNVLDMPPSHEWKTFAKWGEKWGACILSVTLLGQPMVILNSFEHAVEMLEKKSAIYSDRPTLVMGGKMVGWDRTLVLLPYGNRWREYRRIFSSTIGTRRSIQSHIPLLETETQRFLGRLLRQPDGLTQQVRKLSGAIILKMSHGYQVKEGADPFVDTADKATNEFSLATAPGAFLVDIIPLLRHVPNWVPGTGWKKMAAAWAKTVDEMCDLPFNFVKTQMAAGTAVPSLVSKHLEMGLNAASEDLLKDAATSFYTGGADTTVSAIRTFFLAMMRYPEVQKKAQLELDSIIGQDRLPTIADRERLPYINALVKEVLRWNPVVPLGVPHRLTEDDVHGDYVLPKGTLVVANIWHFCHDARTYEQPMEFNPDRFMSAAGKLPERDPRDFIFGFGRRICPGLFLADASVFLACVMTLAAFDICPVDTDIFWADEIEYTTGTISHPPAFNCVVRPRSAKAEALVQSANDFSQD